MMTKNDLIVGVGVAALALGTSCGTASAQTSTRSSVASAQGSAAPSAAQSSDTNGDIVVTAQRREERLITVPASITAETQAALQRRGATQLEDVIRNTPGISNAGAGQGNNTVITIRGVSTGTGYGSLQQNTVALLLDDIPVDPATASIGTTNLRTVDIGRVEVLRGPQGTLFGSGSLSGAVRFITNKPDFSGFGASGEVTGATTRGGEGTFSGNLVVNAPIVDDKLAIRGVCYASRDGGWIENLNTGQKNTNRVETYGGRVSVTYKPIDRLSFALTGIYQDSKDLGAGDSYYSPTPGVPDYRTTSPLARPRVAEIKNTIANLVTTYEFDTVNLTSSSTYQRRESTEDVDYGYFLPVIGAQVGIPTLSGAAPGPATSNFNIYSQELRLSSNGTGPFHWTVGGYYLKSKIFGNSGQVITADAVKPILGTNILAALATSGGQEELAGFGEATLKLSDKFSILGGIRVFQNSRHDVATSIVPFLRQGTNGAPDDVRSKESKAIYKFEADYKPTSDIMLYASASQGYRAGGTIVRVVPELPPAYGPDYTWNFEAGAKTDWLNRALQLNIALYRVNWYDTQISGDFFNGSFSGVLNCSGLCARSQGVEFDLTARPVHGLELTASGTVFKAKWLKDQPAISGSPVAGTQFANTPTFTLNGSAAYTWELGGDNSIELRVDAQHRGKYAYMDYRPQYNLMAPEAFTLVNAAITLAHQDAWSAALFARNLFDERAQINSIADSVTPYQTLIAQPRTVGVQFGVKF